LDGLQRVSRAGRRRFRTRGAFPIAIERSLMDGTDEQLVSERLIALCFVSILRQIVQEVKEPRFFWPMKRPSSVRALTAPVAAPFVSVDRLRSEVNRVKTKPSGI